MTTTVENIFVDLNMAEAKTLLSQEITKSIDYEW